MNFKQEFQSATNRACGGHRKHLVVGATSRGRARLGSKVSGFIALALMAGPSFTIAEEASRILADKAFYTEGSFIAYAAPWSTDVAGGPALKHGVDFADEIVVQPGTFPANVEFSWHWPLTPSKRTGVYGYMFIPAGEVLEGTIDFKAALDFLRSKGRVTGEEWFTGLAFGIEPVAVSGSLQVESSVTYQ